MGQPTTTTKQNKTKQNKTIMKKETAMARVKSAAEKHNISKSSKAYTLIIEALERNRKRLRPVYTLGRGRWVGLMDYFGLTDLLLDRAGIKHKNGNDAPRGGRTGAYIELTHIDFEAEVEILAYMVGGQWEVKEIHADNAYVYKLHHSVKTATDVREWAKYKFCDMYYTIKICKD